MRYSVDRSKGVKADFLSMATYSLRRVGFRRIHQTAVLKVTDFGLSR